MNQSTSLWIIILWITGWPEQPPEIEPTGESCPWVVDDLLDEVGTSTSERVNCGSYRAAQAEEVEAAARCFFSHLADGTAAEFTVNTCIDCSILTTYVGVSEDEIYAVTREADVYGDDRREATVSECRDVVINGGLPECERSMSLYSCDAALEADEPPPMQTRPVVPHTVSQVPSLTASRRAMLHLMLSNQGLEEDMDIDVYIDGTHVVTGDFPFTQHDITEFDIPVPRGRHALRVMSETGDAELFMEVDVSAERWLYVAYFHEEDEGVFAVGRPSATPIGIE